MKAFANLIQGFEIRVANKRTAKGTSADPKSTYLSGSGLISSMGSTPTLEYATGLTNNVGRNPQNSLRGSDKILAEPYMYD